MFKLYAKMTPYSPLTFNATSIIILVISIQQTLTIFINNLQDVVIGAVHGFISKVRCSKKSFLPNNRLVNEF